MLLLRDSFLEELIELEVMYTGEAHLDVHDCGNSIEHLYPILPTVPATTWQDALLPQFE